MMGQERNCALHLCSSRYLETLFPVPNVAPRCLQEPIERPTFEGLVFRLEDFFHGEMQYTEASKLLGDDEEEDEEGEREGEDGGVKF